eukprot:tig00000361_g24401.t1
MKARPRQTLHTLALARLLSTGRLFSDVSFALRPYESHLLERVCEPSLQADVIASKLVQEAAARHAEAHAGSLPDSLALARRHYERIASRPSVLAIRLLGYVLRKVWRLLFKQSGVSVNLPSLRAVVEAARERPGVPLVLVPCHRSHADYLLLSFVLFQYGITVPLIAAGDNLAVPPFGALFRRTGAFFVRRAAAAAAAEAQAHAPGPLQAERALYNAVLAAYVRGAAARGATLEFFIEGGRSRLGSMLPPKLGLLSALTDAALGPASPAGVPRPRPSPSSSPPASFSRPAGSPLSSRPPSSGSGLSDMAGPSAPSAPSADPLAAPDLLLVPVSLQYERCPEAASYALERLGRPKVPESLRAFLSAAWSLLRSPGFGGAHVRFGEPFTLSDYAAARAGGGVGPFRPCPDGPPSPPASPAVPPRLGARSYPSFSALAAAGVPGAPAAGPDARRALVRDLAFDLTDRIGRNTPLVPASLLALLLLCPREGPAPPPAPTPALLPLHLRWLAAELAACGAPLSGPLSRALRSADEAERVASYTLALHSDLLEEPLEDGDASAPLRPARSPAARLQLAFYRGTLLAWLSHDALLLSALRAASSALAGAPAAPAAVLSEATLLRALAPRELALCPAPADAAACAAALEALVARGLAARDPSGSGSFFPAPDPPAPAGAPSFPRLARSLLRPALEASFAVLDAARLAARGAVPCASLAALRSLAAERAEILSCIVPGAPRAPSPGAPAPEPLPALGPEAAATDGIDAAIRWLVGEGLLRDAPPLSAPDPAALAALAARVRAHLL